MINRPDITDILFAAWRMRHRRLNTNSYNNAVYNHLSEYAQATRKVQKLLESAQIEFISSSRLKTALICGLQPGSSCCTDVLMSYKGRSRDSYAVCRIIDSIKGFRSPELCCNFPDCSRSKFSRTKVFNNHPGYWNQIP